MMTYRTLLIAAILFICFGAAFWCFLEYDLHTFQKSLSVSESETQTPAPEVNDGIKGESTQQIEVTNHKEKSEHPPSQNDFLSNDPNEANLLDVENRDEMDEKPLEHFQEPDWSVEELSSDTLEDLWQDPNTSPINANELAPAEYEAYYREQR